MAEAKEEIQTVPMTREEPAHVGGPTTADVHPDEVEAWAAAGWRIVEDEKAQKAKAKK